MRAHILTPRTSSGHTTTASPTTACVPGISADWMPSVYDKVKVGSGAKEQNTQSWVAVASGPVLVGMAAERPLRCAHDDAGQQLSDGECWRGSLPEEAVE